MAGQGQNYFANHVGAPQLLQGTPNYNVEIGEGINPPGEFYPAHYLPTCVSENRIGGSWYVLMPGKVISFDSNGRLVSSGLGMDLAAYSEAYAADSGNAAAKKAAGNAAAQIKYTRDDISAGFTNANSELVNDGDKVVDSMFAASLTVTDPIGIMRYSSLMAPGSNPGDPSTFWKHQYDTGGARAFSRWGYIQVPIVETNTRQEAVQVGSYDHRIALYPDTNGIKLYLGSVEVSAYTQVSGRGALVMGDTITQFTKIGRTYFFNAPAPANFNIRFSPKIDLPFTSLISAGADANVITTNLGELQNWGKAKYIGKSVTFDINSNFAIATDSTTQPVIGRILDIKEGSSKDLALVRTYYRDFGLWQEQPGSATEGRNAILSIANAPKYIARIAVQFNVPFFTN